MWNFFLQKQNNAVKILVLKRWEHMQFQPLLWQWGSAVNSLNFFYVANIWIQYADIIHSKKSKWSVICYLKTSVKCIEGDEVTASVKIHHDNSPITDVCDLL